MSDKKWTVKEGKPRCRNCGSLLRPVDEPAGLRCVNCELSIPLSDAELAELTFDLSD